MTPTEMHEMLIDRPEYLLTLMFSAPNHSEALRSSITVDFTETEVIARVQRQPETRPVPRLLATKQTIFSAVLLYQLIVERGPDFASSLVERAENFARRAAYRNAEMPGRYLSNWTRPAVPPDAESSEFFRDLNISDVDFETAESKTLQAFNFLEDEGLVIDPAFTPEFMILAGLVPLHFSVRTPKGERVYKEIKVTAALWSVDIIRGSKSGQPYTDFEFRVWGIKIVRKLITVMATEYLESEEKIRKTQGKPVLPRKGPPELDP